MSTALVFWLSVSVTRAPMISVAAAVCTLGIEPRLYNYPQVVAAVVVTWACWRCIDRPVMSRACALGASVAAAVTIALIAPDFWMLATQGRVARIVEVQTSGAHPIEDWAPPGSVGMRGLTRWLHECPAPSDRVLVMGYHPQVFFYAERPFAAGMVVSYSSYFTDPASQRHAVSRLRQESVLIVITGLATPSPTKFWSTGLVAPSERCAWQTCRCRASFPGRPAVRRFDPRGRRGILG